MTRRLFFALLCLLLCSLVSSDIYAQLTASDLYHGMKWRMIGPFRGGRTVGATGVPGQPNVFYIGVNNGGVWKTTDYGLTWKPIFDDQPTGSIGAIAVAPSQPETIYVGSGEGLQRPDLSVGDGIYKSTDGGKTWRHLGLRDAQQIGAILVDPRDPNLVYVAALGHPYGPNEERGVFRSTDGGETWKKVLYKDENTGAIALVFDPSNSKIIYADLWSARQGPWENGSWQGPGSGIYKTTDGGNNWRPLTNGLPTFAQGLGRIGITVAPSDPKTVYASVDSRQGGGIYRSDDGGETWQLRGTDPRPWSRGSDFAEIDVDPKNKNVLYASAIAMYKSIDGGLTWTAFKGAPGGDDYHTLWINPDNPQIMLSAVDQGATITVNGGQTWSSWYNQPTAQFYHVITDNQFPYWVYGGQQESGSAGVKSRGDNGAITFRDWRTVGVEEYGYVAPDPLHPNLIYGGKATRFDTNTGQVQNVAPEILRSGKYRFLRTAPILFSPVDPHVLYLAGNVLFKTTNGGDSWDIISPDLSREKPEVPASIGVFRRPEMATQPRRGVIYAVAPSPKDINTIWAGTDDGLIHVTRDGGKTWKNVTPPQIDSWSKISQLDASHFDVNTAYAAVNRIRLDDLKPHIYRTTDGGATWNEIVAGLPDGPINTVKEDPEGRGLLFAGTETAVFYSLNDGAWWQSLRLNMPATSIRDLVVHNDDLVVGTHGRSFWILDDITPLRQINGTNINAELHLFAPQVAYRVKRNVNTDTPLPPEEPVGQNPPDGAIINYSFKRDPATPVTLEIFDSSNQLVRRYASDDKPAPIDPSAYAVPDYWFQRPQTLVAKAGVQRFVWDLKYAPPPAFARGFPISAIYHNTPLYPLGPAVLPGNYTVKLTVNGKSETQPLVVKMDPRVTTNAAGLEEQFKLSMEAYRGMQQTFDTIEEIRKFREQNKANAELEKRAAAIAGEGRSDVSSPGLPGGTIDVRNPDLTKLNNGFSALLEHLQNADLPPTQPMIEAAAELQKVLAKLLGDWNQLKGNSATGANNNYDLLIRNGRVIDGSGKPAFNADVAVKGDRIVRIGDLSQETAARVIDARGLVVAPGFIDMLGQSETYLLIDPRAMSKVMMGVTTEVTGEGESIAPINERQIKEQADFLRRFNLTIDWRTLDEYFKRVERQGMGLNLATFVGATQVREYVIGYDDRPPTPAELEQMKQLVADAMRDGALGVSTSLQYVPARFADTKELVELAKVASQYGGIYATHQRSEANTIDASLNEVFEIAMKAHIRAEIWHLKTAYKKNWGLMPHVLERLRQARAFGIDVSADIYPYVAGSTSLSACLPPWALEGGVERMLARLRDPATRARLKKEISQDSMDWENIYLGSGGPGGVLISAVVNRDLDPLQGKRVSEIAAEQKKDPLDALFDLLLADQGQTSAIYFMMSEADMRAAMQAPFVSFCTDSGARATDGPLAGSKSHPRGWGTYPRVLGHYVRDEHLLSLETAINKMTGAPATRVGLRDRGFLREGMFADITIFDPNKVIDRATFEQPNQYPVGIEYVLINGQVSVDKGQRTAALSGRILRGPGYRS
ncbi:MAG TPA: amidohydrolase family protein [Pyrinomonadaceae bacterium]